jgi:hypothetical protein
MKTGKGITLKIWNMLKEIKDYQEYSDTNTYIKILT